MNTLNSFASHFAFFVIMMFVVAFTFLFSTLLIAVGFKMVGVALLSGYAVVAFGVVSIPCILIGGYVFAKDDAYN